MLVANPKMLWRKVAGKSLDRTRNDPCNLAQWFKLPGVAGYHVYIILIHFLPNSHICDGVLLQFIFT